jgi:hypothetical protein
LAINNEKDFHFIFMIDMSEEKSEAFNNKTKETLKCFVKSLPEDSKFSVISFGSTLEVHT